MTAPPLPLDALNLPPDEIARRVRWARRQGHPHYLWPEVPIAAWREGLLAIERATALVLTGGKADLSAPAARTEALGIAAFTSGLGPLLGYWIETGSVRAAPDVQSLLLLHLAHGRRRAELLDRELKAVLTFLNDAGIDAVVLKGLHTGREYFPDPGTRPAADIDLLVESARFEASCRVLAQAGYAPLVRETRPPKVEWLPPGGPRDGRSLHLTHEGNPRTIEVHSALDRDFFGVRTVHFGPLKPADTGFRQEGTVAARVLAQPLLLAFLATHASHELHHLPLLRLVELILVIRADLAAGLLDWDGLLATLERAGASRFAYPALALAECFVPGTVDPRVGKWLDASATPRMRRVVNGLRPFEAQRLEGLSIQERFMWAQGPREWLRRAAHLLWLSDRERPLARRRLAYVEAILRVLRGRVSIDRPS